MAVRNFYVEAIIYGRATPISGGPASNTGEMTVRLYQRSEGSITEALMIECEECDGMLTTKVYDKNHNLLFSHTTMR